MERKSIILIVDDQESARMTLEGLLTRQGYELAFACNGAEALEKVATVTPDLILLDVMMPGLTGFEVCQQIKATEQWQHIPIILTTALSSKKDLAHGLDVGADDFLSKPLNSMELRARIRSILRIKTQYDKLEKQKYELEAALQLREDLANMLVHDMRNPLTAITGFSDLLLKNRELTPQSLDFIQTIRDEADRLNGFVNDLLLLAKMEQNQLILKHSSVDLKQLVLTVCDNYSITAQLKKIDLVADLPSESNQTSLDVSLFQRVLDNLVSNAVKFSSAESRVTVQLKYVPSGLSSNGVRIRILDEGPGIAATDRERIFEKFEIVALNQKEGSQIGLGLAFVKMVIEAHGGYIFVEDNEPVGSIFTIEI